MFLRTAASLPMTSPPTTLGGILAARMRVWTFALTLVGLIACGLGRSWIATQKDGLQIDEAWHAIAGISYARTGDYRLNPEHPPLAKLWVGWTMPHKTFELPEFRPMQDKLGERDYIDEAFYERNNPHAVQSQMRLSMLAFHGLILLALGWTLRRVFGDVFALSSIGLLLLDPSVAAHLPVVLTDLPLTLLSALSVLCACIAFESWRRWDLVACAVALGLSIGAKHSAIPVALFVAAFGAYRALLPKAPTATAHRWLRLGLVALSLVGAWVVLWGLYGFHFEQSPGAVVDTFNRPIETKIADLNSATYRGVLQFALDTHAMPRAYLWGLADIIRAGVEGRQSVMYVFGQLVYGDTPWYFFPAVLFAKLPIGWLLLSALGFVLLVQKRLPRAWNLTFYTFIAWSAFYMLFIVKGNSGYAGVRHAMPIFPCLALLASGTLMTALSMKTLWLRFSAGLGAAAFLVSSLPTPRPWEYYNELVGGADDAWQYFADDGLENGQRVREIAAYYDANLRGTAEHVYDYYGLFEVEKKTYDLHFHDIKDDVDDRDYVEGTMFVNSRLLGPRPLYDYASFRQAEPIVRLGNVFVYRGKFQIPWLRADRRLSAAYTALDPEKRDPALAEKLLAEVAILYPEDYQSTFQLANLLIERGEVERAIAAYSLCQKYTPEGDSLIGVLAQHIDKLRQFGAQVGPLRDPWLE